MKISSYNIRSVLLVALALALTLPCGFSYAKRGRSAPQNKQQTTQSWVISSADSTSNSIVLETSDKSSSVTLTANSATKITVDGKSATLADLHSGMKATYIASGTTCSSLDAISAPSQKKTGKKNK